MRGWFLGLSGYVRSIACSWSGAVDPRSPPRPGGCPRGRHHARLETTLNPFMFGPAYIDIADLPLPECVARMRQPEVRQAILDGAHVEDRQLGSRVVAWFPHMFRLGDPPDNELDPSESAQAEADRAGRTPPHSDSTWPWSQDMLAEQVVQLTSEQR